MSKELICPFCNGELRKIHPTYVICDNCRITGEDKLWQELIRTRKALDVANNAIDEMLVLDSGKFIQEPAEMWKIAKSAKDKITAEQKD